MGFITLIDSQTAAVAGSSSGIVRVEQEKVTVAATALAYGECVGLQISIDNGRTWTALFEDNIEVCLTSTQPHFTLDSPGLYRAVKPITATACAVVASNRYNDYKGALA